MLKTINYYLDSSAYMAMVRQSVPGDPSWVNKGSLGPVFLNEIHNSDNVKYSKVKTITVSELKDELEIIYDEIAKNILYGDDEGGIPRFLEEASSWQAEYSRLFNQRNMFENKFDDIIDSIMGSDTVIFILHGAGSYSWSNHDRSSVETLMLEHINYLYWDGHDGKQTPLELIYENEFWNKRASTDSKSNLKQFLDSDDGGGYLDNRNKEITVFTKPDSDPENQGKYAAGEMSFSDHGVYL